MGHQRWVEVARDVAARLAADAVERERKGAEPLVEVALLRESGLLPLLVPAAHGGHGQDWAVAHAVLAEVAAADSSVGHLLGYHYLHVWRTTLFDRPDLTEELNRATAEQRWFWAGVANPRDDALVLSDVDGGYLVAGRKFFATGASVADRLVVSGAHATTGRKITFTLDATAGGIRYLGDWDNLGQRLSASGGVEFTDVFVAEHDVLGPQPLPGDALAQRDSLAPLGFQLVLSRVLAAIGRGALTEAARYTRETARAWPASGVEHATDDPHILAGYGSLLSRLEAADLLVDAAARAFADAAARGDALSADERGRTSIRVSHAKVVTSDLAVEITNRLFEFTGARATSAKHGIDRFWRNARTLTLHDPTVYKAAEVGKHLLTGEFPAPTGYS
ncbi:alkylation response protein AidB-like acyl-CoA dehydrogenase [Actinokineospora baliensis]|uniref:acyl-CoA dehydrogenase family protein n=1 Tax=Actinokineospora baliensis TaxID=547056 RepID=UPI0019564BA3|nr:acyl-CoA dehydrogenase family protein [Actinokineospora baliensis]MBM7773499.1 alkylation response protein AidB-like acyl-CoA dehydrogenase [Actinokineospora baliensis]